MNYRYLSDFVRIAARWATAALAALSIPAMAAAYDQSLTRTLNTGKISGIPAANNTQAFLGIPFAKPPVGDLRWRAPQPPESWKATRAAETLPRMCAQKGGPFGEPAPNTFEKPVGSEDCLYLNVWRPNSNADDLPVFFWIHGGSNLVGSIGDPTYDGANLAQRANMVVVTVQYRLGAFGWFNHPDLKTGNPADDSGNFGTLDLVRALDWVKTNARAFGGDPGKVTVAGESAGCINTWSLLMSPLAKDKFQRAMCMSGFPVALPPIAGEAAAKDSAAKLLSADENAPLWLLRWATRPNDAAKKDLAATWLRSVSMEQILKHGSPLAQPYSDGYVIPKDGAAGLLLGSYNKVPLMIGTTNDEATYFTFHGMFGKPTKQELWKLANGTQPVTAEQLLEPETAKYAAPVNEEAMALLNGATDLIIGTLRWNNPQIYRYNFNWSDTPQPWKSTFGATHAIDVPALFGNFVTDKETFFRPFWIPANATSRKAVSDKLIDYTASFVRNGQPSVPNDGQTTWTPWPGPFCGSTCDKRMIFDIKSYMSNADSPSREKTISERTLPPEYREFVREKLLLPLLGEQLSKLLLPY